MSKLSKDKKAILEIYSRKYLKLKALEINTLFLDTPPMELNTLIDTTDEAFQTIKDMSELCRVGVSLYYFSDTLNLTFVRKTQSLSEIVLDIYHCLKPELQELTA